MTTDGRAEIRARIENALMHTGDTRQIIVARGALAATDEVFATRFGNRAAIIVADETTYEVAGRAVTQSLGAGGRIVHEPFVFPTKPTLHADERHVQQLETIFAAHDAIPVAVGSGTINDLTKLAAHRTARPYMVVATAASMDGYAAFGAAITREGFKQTFACPAPEAVIADIDVLTAAPAAMTASGYADLLGKVTAGADWLIANALGIEPIEPDIWAMMQEPLRQMIADPALLREGDTDATERLFLGLVVAGLAMQVARSSRPASGSEHQFSHLWEMQGLTRHGVEVSHGFKVGIGSIAIAALYEQLLTEDLSNLDSAQVCAQWPSRDDLEESVRHAHALSVVSDRAVEESTAKYLDSGSLARRLSVIREQWPALCVRLQTQILAPDVLRRMLTAAGAPADPTDIGLSPSRLHESYALARQIRRRYTVLDLAFETGLLPPLVDALFQPGGYWGGL